MERGRTVRQVNRRYRPTRARSRWARPSARVLIAALLIVCATVFSSSTHLTVPASDPVPSAVPAPPSPVPVPADNTATITLRAAEPLARTTTMRQTTVAGKTFRYCANGSIDNPAREAKRVIFVMHGNDRQPCSVATAALATGTPEQRASTLVISPRFPLKEDRIDTQRELFWTFYAWSQGDPSANEDVQVSSYEVLDELIERARPIPVVVAGFSGGGQFVNRYAAGTSHNPVRFIVVNPSSYLYFTPERPGAPAAQLAICPGYNHYRYGLDGLNDYMSRVGPETLTQRYSQHRVVYLLGDADNDPRSSSMDKTCGALAEGSNRYERGLRYWAYLPKVFGPGIQRHHQLHVVPRAGHNVHAMFQHPAAKRALYE